MNNHISDRIFCNAPLQRTHGGDSACPNKCLNLRSYLISPEYPFVPLYGDETFHIRVVFNRNKGYTLEARDYSNVKSKAGIEKIPINSVAHFKIKSLQQLKAYLNF